MLYPTSESDSSVTNSRDARPLSTALKPPGPDDISAASADGPKQPVLKHYPFTVKGNQRRAFNCAWFKQYPCISYSVLSDAVFLFCMSTFLDG